MENYEILLEKWRDDELNDEEWEEIRNVITNKLENREALNSTEADIIVYEDIFEFITIDYLEHIKNSYWLAKFIFKVDNGNFYSIEGAYSPECGWDDIDEQICKRLEKKQVMVEKWVEVE